MTVADAIKCFDKDVTRRRFVAGSYVNGRYVEGSYSDSTIRASVQPMKSDEIMRPPEGQRQRGHVKIYTPSDLRVVDDTAKTKADHIIDGSTTWEVTMVDNWIDEGGYYKAEAVEVGP